MFPDPVENTALDCLNAWPEGTEGHEIDEEVIHIINKLCQLHGYGRVPQLANAIEEIWRDPETAIPKWQAFRLQHLQNISGTFPVETGYEIEGV